MSSTKLEVHITYRNDAGGGPSHGHRQHAQKIGKGRAFGSGDVFADRQTHRQTHTHIHHNTGKWILTEVRTTTSYHDHNRVRQQCEEA